MSARVVIDPGHGGEAPVGGSSPNRVRGPAGLAEKDLALDVARRIERHLDGRDVDVSLTRSGDQNVALGSRAARAKAASAEVFVSLHFGGGRPQGTSACVHSRAGERSEKLARELSAAVATAAGLPDRGVERADVAVLAPDLHDERTCCVLLEPSALDDPGEERRLGDPAYRERLAGAVSQTLREWTRRPVEPAARTQAAAAASRNAAVVVGIDAYGAAPLRYAGSDATWAAEWLGRAFGVSRERLKVLRDAEATGAAVRAALAASAATLGPDDTLFFWFSGRGGHAGSAPTLLAADGEALGDAQIGAAVGRPCDVVVLADAGFGSEVAPGGRSAPPGKVTPAPANPARVRWIAAAAPGHDAFEHPAARHGLFTAALAERANLPDLHLTDAGLVGLLAGEMADLGLRVGLDAQPRPWRSPGASRVLGQPPAHAPAPLSPVHHYVPLVAQTNEMSCWAAAAAMVVGWRERSHVDDVGVAKHAGVLDAFRLGLRPQDTHTLAQAFRLAAEPPKHYSAPELHAMLRRVGPLWIGEADPDLHVVVLHGMHGDGTDDGTQVVVADPWPVGTGERYTLTFREFTRNFRAAARQVGVHVQLLHAGGRPDRLQEVS